MGILSCTAAQYVRTKLHDCSTYLWECITFSCSSTALINLKAWFWASCSLLLIFIWQLLDNLPKREETAVDVASLFEASTCNTQTSAMPSHAITLHSCFQWSLKINAAKLLLPNSNQRSALTLCSSLTCSFGSSQIHQILYDNHGHTSAHKQEIYIQKKRLLDLV